MNYLIATVATLLGCYFFLALLYSKWRTSWRGSSEPAGRLTHLGFAIVLLLMGGLFLVHPDGGIAPKYLGFAIIAGFALAAIGHVIDD